MADIRVDLNYKHELMASYEFSDFAAANSFIVQAKALADVLSGSAVTCRVTISALTVEETPSQLGLDLTSAIVANKGP
jgi:hypothetical protein